MKNIPYSKEQLMRANVRLMEKNRHHREVVGNIKLKLRDFRKDANTIMKMSRDNAVKQEAFRLSCDIRDLLESMDDRNK